MLKLRISSLYLLVWMLAAAVSLAGPAPVFSANGTNVQGTIHPPLEKRWSKELTMDSQQPPIVAGYTVYVTAPGDPPVVRAVDLANGRVKWEFPLDKSSGPSAPRITVQKGIVYVAGGNRVYALRDEGKSYDHLWSVPANHAEEAPVTGEYAVYVREQGDQLTALYPASGERMRQDTALSASRPATLAGNKLIVTNERTMTAYLETRHGLHLSWSLTLNSGGSETLLTRPAYARGLLFVGLGQTVYGISAESGQVRWKTQLSAPVAVEPVIGPELVYVKTANGGTVALQGKTGRVVWQRTQPSEGLPLLAGRLMYLAEPPNAVAVDAMTGKPLATVPLVTDGGLASIRLAAGNSFLVANTGGWELSALLPRQQNIKIYLDGELLGEKVESYDRVPVIVNGRVLAPMRAILETLGAKVSWNEAKRTIEAVHGERKLLITVGQSDAWVNGKKVRLDVPPLVLDGRTMVPLRFVSEFLDTSVHWDGETRSVFIYRTKVFGGQKLLIDGKEVPGGITLYHHGYYRVLFGDAKPLFDHLGATIRVDRPFAQATVTVGKDSFVFGPQKYVMVNERKISVYGPFFMSEGLSKEGRFFLDLDFFAKAYGWKYQWDRDQQTLHIWTNPFST